ncbi:hypothetical protein NCCP2716_06810 [Sporosarcina sp. NCCP-2716]|uniref:DUF2653 family protein n=1 Tax=Sporosarcina sp. NCCP-2716 TaxID=2943679 RepID=UPI0020845248|nr:DUF2653 family protein [Sporosarcina sp. NCCP-2716]GKV68183.1 hypothetical protein NCCP2716_06810 [Sporosarcina sp. NCCP-2716]
MIEEQDIINAICLYQARQHDTEPETVEVELCYEDDEGFFAEAYVDGSKLTMNTFDMTQALRMWIEEQLHQDPYAAGIKLLLDDERGIVAALL